MSKKKAFSASIEILNFENRTIIKGDMAQNVSEGEIQAVGHGICVPLPLELQACLSDGQCLDRTLDKFSLIYGPHLLFGKWGKFTYTIF